MIPILGRGYLRRTSATLTFTGAANLGQAGTNSTIFTVTGEILVVYLVPFCTTLLTQAMATATVSLGVTGSLAAFIAATNSVDIDANEFWVDTTPDANVVQIPAALIDAAITSDILVAAATQDTDAGVIRFDLYYVPLSSDGLAA